MGEVRMKVGLTHWVNYIQPLKSQCAKMWRSSDLLFMSNFNNALRIWVLIVSGDSERRPAIWRLVKPKQVSAVTSCSRGERDSHLGRSSLME